MWLWWNDNLKYPKAAQITFVPHQICNQSVLIDIFEALLEYSEFKFLNKNSKYSAYVITIFITNCVV